LQFVDEMMKEIATEKPKVQCREHIDSVRTMKKTLREHYRKKRAAYGLDHPGFYDRDLQRLFSTSRKFGCPSAATYIRQVRNKLREDVAKWTGEHQYTIDQVLTEMIQRCRDLKLFMDRSSRTVERELLILVTVQTMNYLLGGYHRVALQIRHPNAFRDQWPESPRTGARRSRGGSPKPDLFGAADTAEDSFAKFHVSALGPHQARGLFVRRALDRAVVHLFQELLALFGNL
jgi:hypothetical protein